MDFLKPAIFCEKYTSKRHRPLCSIDAMANSGYHPGVGPIASLLGFWNFSFDGKWPIQRKRVAFWNLFENHRIWYTYYFKYMYINIYIYTLVPGDWGVAGHCFPHVNQDDLGPSICHLTLTPMSHWYNVRKPGKTMILGSIASRIITRVGDVFRRWPRSKGTMVVCHPNTWLGHGHISWHGHVGVDTVCLGIEKI